MNRSLKAGVSAISGFGLNVFTNDELETLHSATLEILWNMGIKVESRSF